MNSIVLTGFSDEITSNFTTQLKTVVALELGHIEIRGVNGRNIIDHSPAEAEDIKRQLAEYGVSVSAIGSPCGKIGTTDDFEPHFKAFTNAVALCEVLSTNYIRMFSFYVPNGVNPENSRGQVLSRLERMVEYASRRGVVLLHENEKGIYGDSAARCKDILAHFDSPHLRGVFDFANFIQCEQDTAEAYEMLAPYISYIHIKDAVLGSGRVVPAGMGDGRVAELLKRFRDDGYGGFLSLEPHLGNFVGFQALERDGGGEDKKPNRDGRESFTIALNALKSILWDLNWK